MADVFDSLLPRIVEKNFNELVFKRYVQLASALPSDREKHKKILTLATSVLQMRPDLSLRLGLHLFRHDFRDRNVHRLLSLALQKSGGPTKAALVSQLCERLDRPTTIPKQEVIREVKSVRETWDDNRRQSIPELDIFLKQD